MPEPLPSHVLLHRSFDDFDDLACEARHWDLDFKQLDSGPFDGQSLQGAAGRILFSEARFGRALHQRGSAPPRMRTFGIPARRDVRFTWRGKSITADDLLAFPLSGELDGISRPGFHIFTISLPESLLEEIAEGTDAGQLLTLLGTEKVTCQSSTMDRIRWRLRRLVDAAIKDASILANPSVLQELEFEIPRQLVDAMLAPRMPSHAATGRQRDMAIKRAEAYIAENQDHPISVRDVCKVAKVSERTLQYAFLEYFGITPKAYIKAIRLNRVRRDLKRAEPNDAKIGEIAGRSGFWHMGQFAADYRKQFGELPSQTFQRVTI